MVLGAAQGVRASHLSSAQRLAGPVRWGAVLAAASYFRGCRTWVDVYTLSILPGLCEATRRIIAFVCWPWRRRLRLRMYVLLKEHARVYSEEWVRGCAMPSCYPQGPQYARTTSSQAARTLSAPLLRASIHPAASRQVVLRVGFPPCESSVLHCTDVPWWHDNPCCIDVSYVRFVLHAFRLSCGSVHAMLSHVLYFCRLFLCLSWRYTDAFFFSSLYSTSSRIVM
jgi:hypothetical protein